MKSLVKLDKIIIHSLSENMAKAETWKRIFFLFVQKNFFNFNLQVILASVCVFCSTSFLFVTAQVWIKASEKSIPYWAKICWKKLMRIGLWNKNCVWRKIYCDEFVVPCVNKIENIRTGNENLIRLKFLSNELFVWRGFLQLNCQYSPWCIGWWSHTPWARCLLPHRSKREGSWATSRWQHIRSIPSLPVSGEGGSLQSGRSPVTRY